MNTPKTVSTIEKILFFIEYWWIIVFAINMSNTVQQNAMEPSNVNHDASSIVRTFESMVSGMMVTTRGIVA